MGDFEEGFLSGNLEISTKYLNSSCEEARNIFCESCARKFHGFEVVPQRPIKSESEINCGKQTTSISCCIVFSKQLLSSYRGRVLKGAPLLHEVPGTLRLVCGYFGEKNVWERCFHKTDHCIYFVSKWLALPYAMNFICVCVFLSNLTRILMTFVSSNVWGSR